MWLAEDIFSSAGALFFYPYTLEVSDLIEQSLKKHNAVVYMFIAGTRGKSCDDA